MNRLFLRKSVIKPEKCNQFQGSEKSEIERRKLNVEPLEFSTEKRKTEVISHFRLMAEDMGLEPTGLLHLT